MYHSLGYPILIGTSRKKFIGQLANKYDSRERIGAHFGIGSVLVISRSSDFRVHNVKELNKELQFFKEILSNNEKINILELME